MRVRTLVLPLILAALAVAPALAQDEELILDNRTSTIQAVPRATPARGEEATPAPQGEPSPTPNPSDVIVAIVNSRALTRAELDARVSERYAELAKEVQSRFGGVVSTIDPEFKDMVLELETDPNEVLAEQKEAIEKAMRLEESENLQAWVEHSMMSDEARRQGIVISETEFRERLGAAERDSNLDAATLESALERARVSRADYERSVYDALLIEKLLKKFIELNYTEDQFRAAFKSAPALFYEPPKYSLAHFAVALESTRDKGAIDAAKQVAERVRAELSKGAEPEQLFERPEFNNPDQGWGGLITSYMTLDEGILAPVVQVKGAKLAVGEVSEVLVNQAREEGKIVTRSIHVVKMLDIIPESGKTFESALPAIQRSMTEIARTRLLERLREARTHRVITNLGGIPPGKIPTPEKMRTDQANAQPISLVLPKS